MAGARPTTASTGNVLILWGGGFDEATTAIFASELRQAGLPVKVVGVVGRQAAGLHGLRLGADLTLGDALLLAHQAIAVVLPCTAATMRRIDNDPRVCDLLQRACANDAALVVQDAGVVAVSCIRGLTSSGQSIIAYSDADDLGAFVRGLAAAWLSRVE
ncbi:MAG: hypothetical protein KJZ93_30530 [Caldilineaceae bacterium]|nr:hypothetical protein [Caldilineaceae bacterium]